MRKVDVKVIDLGPSSAKPTLHQNANSLSSHLDSEQEPDSTRVILVESISADVIELLGRKFSLDPRFFENHLRGIQEFLADHIPDDLYLRNSEPLPPYNPQSHFTPSSAKRKQISTRLVLEIALLRSQTYTCSSTQIVLIHTILATALDFHAAAIYELSLARYRLNSSHTNRPKESSLPRGEARQSLEIEVQSLEAAHINVQWNQVQVLEFLRQEQEINFTRSVGRLTTIAFLFLPFSTVATILSIQDAMRFGVFVGLALPMLVLCIVVGIWGASTADIMKAIGGWSRVSWMRCTAYLRELSLSSGIEKTVKEPDVESKAESSGSLYYCSGSNDSTDELLDLYQTVSAAKAGQDEKSMGILIAEMQSMPSLRRRPPGKLSTSST
ncbi:hypothetical protein V502_05817 [Pseudogymnoascus sp. VKM F-4520 (FW-2644)]|nr:hypothetical protein V502_05817 [Pseudogymnoascus sp. VKM F-4520 (FW-2644)]